MAAPTRCWSRAKRNCDTSVSDMQAERRQHGSSEATFGCLVSTVHFTDNVRSCPQRDQRNLDVCIPRRFDNFGVS